MNELPKDWPKPGPIDLTLHDLPHPSSATEWWYVNTHVTTADGRRRSLFAAFFRTLWRKDPRSQAPVHAHCVTWALSDPEARIFLPCSRVDAQAPAIWLERLRKGAGARDDRINRAFAEIFERGRVPLPDRTFEGEVHVGKNRLELDFGGARFEKTDEGAYRLSLLEPRTGTGCDLLLRPEKPPARHGDDGVVRGPSGEDMFYYFIPRCRVTGSVVTDGIAQPVTTGQGWYDHEFGGYHRKVAGDGGGAAGAERGVGVGAEGEGNTEGGARAKSALGVERGGKVDRAEKRERAEKVEREDEVAWNWVAAQLDDGEDVTAYSLVRQRDRKVLGQWAIVVDRNGRQTSYTDMAFRPARSWRSTRTFNDYPVSWTLAVPEAGLELAIEAAFEDQEFITSVKKGGFWEGRCEIRGTSRGAPVRGEAYVERSGFTILDDLDAFFRAVGEEVRHRVAKTLPLEPTLAETRVLIASDDRPHWVEDVDRERLSRSLIRPVREICDRGGKSWRSYAALACCDVVEGDSRRFVQWLAVPELLHVGSLIVDDVQDRSQTRRGGPSCHVVHGEAKAINAGTAAYFLAQRLLISSEVSPAAKLRLYDLYFEAMRAGHAGQALDLDGLADLMDAAVESGSSLELERAILATHRLKTAAPAASLARMGAVAGGGSHAQVEAVGQFFEALGLAFQIVDDVLNLRGFEGNLKLRGEDIANGTVTLPVAKAMGRVAASERAWLWSTLRSKPESRDVIASVVALLERSGALSACDEDARRLVENAWASADPLLPDSSAKAMLRAFGWYVLERHY